MSVDAIKKFHPIYSMEEFAKDFSSVVENSIEKSDEQITLICFANREVMRFARYITGDDYVPVPLENFCIVPDDVFLSLESTSDDSEAICYPYYRSIVIRESGCDTFLRFGRSVIHELIHIYAPVFRRPYYCVGIEIGEKFKGVTEAIVCSVQMILHHVLLEHPLLTEEKDRFKRLYDALPKGERLDDISLFDENEKPVYFGYNDLAYFLKMVCMEVSVKDSTESPGGVLQTFFNAHFTGQLLPLARIIERTFGKGSFRVLGNMGTEEDWGLETFNALKEVQFQNARDSSSV